LMELYYSLLTERPAWSGEDFKKKSMGLMR
jgi:hypothetical protein